MFSIKPLILVAAIGSLAGCATSNPDVVSRYDTQRISTVVDATVLSVRPVTIDGSQSGVGTVAGAVVGGVAGSNVGGPRGSAIVGIAGAVIGGLVGNAVERNATKENGVELLLQLNNGERRQITQGVGSDQFAVGEPVVIITTGGRVRVMRAPDVSPGSAAPSAYPPAPYPAPAQ